MAKLSRKSIFFTHFHKICWANFSKCWANFATYGLRGNTGVNTLSKMVNHFVKSSKFCIVQTIWFCSNSPACVLLPMSASAIPTWGIKCPIGKSLFVSPELSSGRDLVIQMSVRRAACGVQRAASAVRRPPSMVFCPEHISGTVWPTLMIFGMWVGLGLKLHMLNFGRGRCLLST